MITTDLRHASADEAAKALDRHADLSARELNAALANAFERIASLERDRDELNEWFRTFNEMVNTIPAHEPESDDAS